VDRPAAFSIQQEENEGSAEKGTQGQWFLRGKGKGVYDREEGKGDWRFIGKGEAPAPINSHPKGKEEKTAE